MKLFEDLPSTNRPITAEMLNQIQDNLVVVSATEPTGDNREKVWIQKGKNLFDKNNCLTYAWVGDNGTIINSNDNNVLSALIPCKPNTKYTLSGFVPNAYIIVIGFDSSRKYTWTITNQLETRNVKTITTGANDNFIKVGFGYAVPNLSTLMVNQGDVALPYEEYITPKTYVKNDNEVYEEFYNKENLDNYSTSEQLIGKWHNGNNVYRKTLLIDVSNFNGEQEHFINYSDYGISGNIVVNNYKGLCERFDQVWQVLPCTLEEWHIDIYDFKETQFTIKISQNQKNIGLRILTLILEYEHRSW